MHIQKTKELTRLRGGDALRIAVRTGLLLGLLLLLFATGCAKLPASTAPVGGTASGDAITKTARSNIGVRYKAGGTSPSVGFDCSGLVCWTYGQYGIALPRTAREQMDVGTAVRKENLRPGDLVVFKISNRRGYHCGIYSGNGMFIHSPSTGKTVREESINSNYWRGRFITARRVSQLQ